jgi:hypothetical protein
MLLSARVAPSDLIGALATAIEAIEDAGRALACGVALARFLLSDGLTLPAPAPGIGAPPERLVASRVTPNS